MNELALFAGAGGGILGGKLLGWRCVAAVEKDSYCQSILLARQADGVLPVFPIWDDVTTFDGRPWRGVVDVISGGFPCQDISVAGKGAGIDGDRSGLWKHMARIIDEVRPKIVWVENSPMLIRRGLTRVLSDLASMGYDARWGIIGADDAGAPHHRKRIWILAYASGFAGRKLWERSSETARSSKGMGNASSTRRERVNNNKKPSERIQQESCERCKNLEYPNCERCAELITAEIPGKTGFNNWPDNSWWKSDPADVFDALRERQPGQGEYEQPMDSESARETKTDHAQPDSERNQWGLKSGMGRVVNGVAHRVDRLKALGNGQVSAVAALAWRILSGK